MEKERVFYIEYWKGTVFKDAIKTGKGNLLEYLSLLIDKGYPFKVKEI